MMGRTAELSTSRFSAAAACGMGCWLVSRACTRAPYSSGRMRRFTTHLWNQAALSARPEEYGALVQARLTNQHPMPQAAAALNHDVLNSAALPLIYAHNNNQSYLLPQ